MRRRARSFRTAPLVACLVAVTFLAACQPQVTRIPVGPTRVVDIDRVTRAFEDICLRTAPDFRKARDSFARHGLTVNSGNGIVYDDSGTMSVRVDDVSTARGQRLRCSIVYEDPNRFIARDRIDAMLRRAPGQVRGKRSARFPASSGQPREGRAWTYRTRGLTGELLDVPHAGGADLGVLILQFPANRT